MLLISLPVEQLVALAVLAVVGGGWFVARIRRRRPDNTTLQLELDHEYRIRRRRDGAGDQQESARPLSKPPAGEKLQQNLETFRRSHQRDQPLDTQTFTSGPPTITGPLEIPLPRPVKNEETLRSEEYEGISPVSEPPVQAQTAPKPPPAPEQDPLQASSVRITVEKPVVFEELKGQRSEQRLPLLETPIREQNSTLAERMKRAEVPSQSPPPLGSDNILEIPAAIPAAAIRPSQEVFSSVIDVTGQTARIPASDQTNGLVKYPRGVPYWEHEYIYSESEVEYATPIQQDFYREFRTAFLRGEHYDLEGNSNYAFILLFDLVATYNHVSDLPRVERQLERLGEFYPKTRMYIRNSLYDWMNQIGDAVGIERYRPAYEYGRSNWEDQWLLGNKHKTRLSLREDEVKLLNRIPYQRNNFLDIQFCGDEVLRLFLRVGLKLKEDFERFGTKLSTEIAEVYDIIARKHFRYRKGSANYKEFIESGETDLLDILFRYCENAVREAFGNKRKRNIDLYYTGEVETAVNDRLISPLLLLIEFELGAINAPDRATEVILNSQNPTRWKAKLEKLKETNDGGFVDEVVDLEKLNEKNPSKENIYFEASKFIAKTDKRAALELYVRYVECDLRSDKFDNKKLTKTLQKSLFSDEQQVRDFENIVATLIQMKDLANAITAVNELYVPKRKRIKLSSDAIRDARVKHSGTVDLLNEYLQDDPEPEVARIEHGEDIVLNIPSVEAVRACRITAIELNPAQHDLLEQFERAGFSMGHGELETFATGNGLFKNQLIESINEVCYELLDDVLVEEEEDGYVVDEGYFRKIFPE